MLSLPKYNFDLNGTCHSEGGTTEESFTQKLRFFDSEYIWNALNDITGHKKSDQIGRFLNI